MGDLRVCRVFLILPVRQPAHSGHPFRLATKERWSLPAIRSVNHEQLTLYPPHRHRLPSPALLIDRNAPLDVLHANAAARVLAVTQLMETFSSREVQNADSVDLKHLAMTATLLLRDGCDLLDVLGWRLQPR